MASKRYSAERSGALVASFFSRWSGGTGGPPRHAPSWPLLGRGKWAADSRAQGTRSPVRDIGGQAGETGNRAWNSPISEGDTRR